MSDSNEPKKPSKLRRAFAGAAKNILNKRNLIVNGVIATGMTALGVAFAVPAALSLATIGTGVASLVAFDAAVGAYKALKNKTPKND